MRHNRGRKWPRNRIGPAFNQQILQQNKLNTKTPRRTQPITKINQNYTYIGRCRCGFGPNAYYQTPEGNIIHANQINQPPKIKIEPPKRISSQNLLKSTNTTPMETYWSCDRCGAKVRDDAYYCTECGNEMINSSFVTKKDQINILKDQIKDLKNQMKRLKKGYL